MNTSLLQKDTRITARKKSVAKTNSSLKDIAAATKAAAVKGAEAAAWTAAAAAATEDAQATRNAELLKARIAGTDASGKAGSKGIQALRAKLIRKEAAPGELSCSR